MLCLYNIFTATLLSVIGSLKPIFITVRKEQKNAKGLSWLMPLAMIDINTWK